MNPKPVSAPVPAELTRTLRLEGLALLLGTLLAYQALGGNWWLFALLILAPDLSFLAAASGDMKLATRAYNLAHTTVVPIALGLLAWLTGMTVALPYLVIWLAHIGADRALGYGLKFPGDLHMTHLGPSGLGKKAARRADPR